MKEHKIEVIPYLSFQGNCEKAVHTYIETFGGEILFLSRWSESAGDVPPEWIGKVMHVEFLLGSTRMAAGDVFDGTKTNADVKLMIHMDSEAEALRTVSVLAEGGRVLSPLAPHPKPDDSGCGSITRDRFGFTWIITCPNLAKEQKQ